jgi:fructose-1-phosphate kinase PfkB-like protein
LREAIKHRPFAVKPNRAEAEELLGHQVGAGVEGLVVAARKIQTEFGVEWVVLSDGKDGMIVAGPDSVAHGKSELSAEAASKIVNDQGCGDSVVAAFAVAVSSSSSSLSSSLGVVPDAATLVRSLVVAGTTNLFSQRPGELLADYLASISDEHSKGTFVKVVVTPIAFSDVVAS